MIKIIKHLLYGSDTHKETQKANNTKSYGNIDNIDHYELNMERRLGSKIEKNKH